MGSACEKSEIREASEYQLQSDFVFPYTTRQVTSAVGGKKKESQQSSSMLHHSVPPAAAAMAELQRGLNTSKIACQAFTDDSNHCCEEYCSLSADDARRARLILRECALPYSLRTSLELIPLLLCIRHRHDDYYWIPLLLDLLGINSSMDDTKTTDIKCRAVALKERWSSSLQSILESLVAHLREHTR